MLANCRSKSATASPFVKSPRSIVADPSKNSFPHDAIRRLQVDERDAETPGGLEDCARVMLGAL